MKKEEDGEEENEEEKEAKGRSRSSTNSQWLSLANIYIFFNIKFISDSQALPIPN